MSGLFLRGRSIGMAIIVNYDHVRPRKRFSYAHEYAHAILDRDRSATISSRDNASELIEKRANAFAAAFLMPEEGVQEFLRLSNKGLGSRQERQIYDVATEVSIDVEIRTQPGSQTITYQDVAMIAYQFGVSYQAAAYRLVSIGIISHNICDNLLGKEEFGKQFLEIMKLNEHGLKTQDRELETQVIRLATEAYRRQEISRGRLIDVGKIFHLPGRQLLELADAA
jgi:Zn-dependent peptidase ImmA (M78 family)